MNPVTKAIKELTGVEIHQYKYPGATSMFYLSSDRYIFCGRDYVGLYNANTSRRMFCMEHNGKLPKHEVMALFLVEAYRYQIRYKLRAFLPEEVFQALAQGGQANVVRSGSAGNSDE